MSARDRIDRYLDDCLAALRREEYTLHYDEEFDRQLFRAIAVQTWSGYGGSSQELSFVFAKFKRLNQDKFDDFMDDACDYSAENCQLDVSNRLWVYPIAMAEEASDGVIRRLREEEPRSQKSGCTVIPIVYDANDDVTFYCEDPEWEDFRQDELEMAWRFVLLKR